MWWVHSSSCGWVGKLAVDQQVGDLEVARPLGELLDRVAAVLEDALLAVDVRDRGATRRGRHVGGVVGHQAEVVLVDLDVAKLGGADRPVFDRNLVLLPGSVVGDRQGLCRRRCAGAVSLLASQSSWRSSRAVAGVRVVCWPEPSGIPAFNLVPGRCWRDARRRRVRTPSGSGAGDALPARGDACPGAGRRVSEGGSTRVRRRVDARPGARGATSGTRWSGRQRPSRAIISTKLTAITPRAPRSLSGNAGRVRPTAARLSAQTTSSPPAM